MSDQSKVLVTGAGGFIGSHLTERLLTEGYKVRAFVHYRGNEPENWLRDRKGQARLEIFPGDITDSACVDEAVRGCDTVYHLAALIAIPYSYIAPLSYVRTNAEGTTNILQSSRKHGVHRVLHTSTSEVYGTARTTPITEEHCLQGQSPYSASKIAADKIAESYYCSFGLPVVTIRPFNTFGPRQSSRAIIPSVIAQMAKGLPIKLGNTAPLRDFNYVENTVEGFLAGARAQGIEGETINLGSGREISIGDLVLLIGELMESKSELQIETRRMRPDASEVMRLLASNEKAKRLLGWMPKITLEEGLRRTIAWIKDHPQYFETHSYHV